MTIRIGNSARWWVVMAIATIFGAASTAPAQHKAPAATSCPPPPCPTAPAAPPSEPSRIFDTTTAEAPAPPGLLAGAIGTDGRAVGLPAYIDSAVPRNTLRFRFDSAYDNNRPDRAEFFYAKCGCFRLAGQDPKAFGPPLSETKVDYQDYRTYLELSRNNRVSAFIEVPFRAINPEVNDNTAGLGDMDAGFKAAILDGDCYVVSFQFRTYFKTGDSDRGLGTNNVNLEPAILAHYRLSDRLILDGEFRDWIPLDGTDFAGNIIRYGVGLSYLLVNNEDWSFAPVAEFVGWTVLGGKEFDGTTGGLFDADGDTIINFKIGGRMNFGESSSLYIGYGRALTGEVWYKDILRVEYRLTF